MNYPLKVWNNFFSNLRAKGTQDYSSLFISSDYAGWSLDADAKQLEQFCSQLGIQSFYAQPWPSTRQCVHYCSHFSLMDQSIFKQGHRISTDYFHGKPEQGAEFLKVFQALQKNHSQIHRIRVSCSEMKDVVLSSGIAPEKVHLIHLGIDTDLYQPQGIDFKKSLRDRLKIPQNAFVIGSFQKDGSGWGEGLEPKWVKGPDIFLKTLETLKPKIPKLHVLILGPARGFVKQGLEKLGVPYTHDYLKNPNDVAPFYHALDTYLVSSREEGGPKSILESMASGVPIVSTRVGQAIDLIRDGHNGFLCNVDDVSALSQRVMQVYESSSEKQTWIQNGRNTALANSFESQTGLWSKFFLNYVESRGVEYVSS